ncbi:MAG TPA: polysaccharide lyase 8 family protein [Bryobacteraceae bacterium]|jgi:hyaluronate lyase|nr:polysaccharide lyase 8 family protein [Bryobacteraceae bacterium]
MMKLLVTLAVLPALCAADTFDDLRLRWRNILNGGGSPDTTIAQVRSRLTSIESSARTNWASLQKDAGRRALWTDIASGAISAHISSNYSRVRTLALGWATPGQSYYQDPDLLADIRSALNWLDANRYHARVAQEYDNWWDWEIGTPAILADIAILIYDHLTPDELARYMAAIERFDSNPAIMIVNTVSTGANRADKCKIAILRGILVRDAQKIRLGVNLLSPVFAYVTSGDGFYVDGSFIQHTRHPYTGSYGLVLLGDIADLLYLLNGSEFDVTDPGRDNVLRWATESFSPLIYKGAMMDTVRGRAVSRNSSPDHGIGHSVISAVLRITQFAQPVEADALRRSIKLWLQQDTTRDFASNLAFDLIGEARRIIGDESIAPAEPPWASYVFASMDRAVHLRPNWAAAIAVHSSRVYNYESINNENLRGWHTGDGMTYLYTGDLLQFADSFWPTVDPQRLPGTTVVAGSTARQSQTGGSSAVGGVSLDGYSAVMMQLSPDGRQLSAKKSWFLFDDEMVALGADIRSTADGRNVETIVENRRLTGDPLFTADPAGAWAYVANIGYYFPDGMPQSAAIARTGAWRDINGGGPATSLSARYLTLWFDHGIMPAGAKYAYLVLPGKTAAEIAGYASSPAVQIVQNDADVQAVTHAGVGIRAANFWTAGSRTAAGITSDGVASVVTHAAGAEIHIAVSDPTQANNGILHVDVEGSASAVISSDEGVTVDRLTPSIRLSVNVRNARGRTFRVTLASGE